MKHHFFKAFGTILFAGILSTCALAQKNSNNKSNDNSNNNKIDEDKEIVIKKTGDKKTKFTLEIENGEVKINGKPLSEFENENISIEIEDGNFARVFAPGTPRSAFRTTPLEKYTENKPVLGVMTDDDENGAKITSVTKGSAAEKAGLKKGDIIAKINNDKIENARDLTATIGKLKVDDKVNITIKRENKEQQLAATLGRRTGTTTLYGSPDVNFDWEHLNDIRLNETTTFNFQRGRLGIKAQDTEDEKGVKVLEVDPESFAAKSGIKEGDVIMQFNGEDVNSATKLAEVARESRDKNNIPVTVTRDGKSQNIDIKIPKKLKTANL